MVAGLLRLQSLDLPLDRDEGEYATLAWLWRSNQGLVYRDYHEQKPPLAPAFYAASQGLLGESLEALRASALLWQLATAALLSLLGARLFGFQAGLWAGLAFALFSTGQRIQGLGANTESFLSLWLGLAFLSLLKPQPRWLLAGSLVGLASLFKQPAVLALPAFAFAFEPGPGLSRRRAAFRLALGAALPWVFVLAFFATQGAAPAFWENVVSYNFRYVGAGLAAWWQGARAAFLGLAPEQGALWVLAALGGWKLRKDGSFSALPLFAWGLSMALGAGLSGRFYPHYFQPLAAPLALLAGFGITTIGRAWIRAGAALACLGFFAMTNGPTWAAKDGAEKSRALFGTELFSQAARAAEVVAMRSPEGSRLFIWGAEAEAYYLSRRAPATRFLYYYLFTGEAPPVKGGEEEVLAALEDPWTSAVIAQPLDPRDPFQRRMVELMQKHFHPRVDLAPPFIVGIRKR